MSGMEHQQNMMTERQRRVSSWLAGISAFIGLVFFIFALAAVFIIQEGVMGLPDKVLLPATAVVFLANLAGLLLIRRRSGMLGAWIVFFAGVLILPLFAAMVLKGIWIVSIFSIVVFAYIFGGNLFQKASEQRWVAVFTGVALLLIIAVELLDPSFREESSVNTPVVGAVVTAVSALGIIAAFLRRTLTGNIRTKIVTGILITGGISLLVLAFFAIQRAGDLVDALSGRLETTIVLLAEEQLVNAVSTEAHLASEYFDETAMQIKQLSDLYVKLYKEEKALTQGSYWDAAEKLIPLGDGKYGNPSTDKASVFVPSFVDVNEELIKELNRSAYLDFSIPQLLENNSSLLAVYYIEDNGVLRYYPNIELASLLPADFDATTRPYYKISSPLFNPQRTVRWTIPYEDAAGGGLVVTASTPIYINNSFHGMVAADIQLSTLTEQISAIKFGSSGYAFMLDDAGRIIYMPEAGYRLFGISRADFAGEDFEQQTILGKGSQDLNSITTRMVAGGTGLNTYVADEIEYYVSFSPIEANGYSLAIVVPAIELQGAISISQAETENLTASALRTGTIILLLLLFGAVIISLALGQVISQPILRLTQTANQILEGNLTAQANVTSSDEIGTLAQAFNAMTGRLRETLSGLEKTVDERTAELSEANENNQRRARQFQSIAQVARTISSTLDLDSLLTQITNVISREFNFYHVGIFLLDPTKQYAVLSASNSQGGQKMLQDGHRLKVGEKGLVGFVSSTGKPRVASDTGADAVFFNNPNLPNTRSEISLPLRAGDEVIGVLDVQSDESDAFSREDISILSTLADQVSIAIQNARQNEETRSLLAESEALSRQFVQTGWNQFTKRQNLFGLRHTGAKATLIYDDKKSNGSSGDTQTLKGKGAVISLPIKLRGEVIGTVDIRSADNRQWDQDEMDIITAIIERAAIAMENSRLIDDAQRRAAREQAIGEMAASIGTYTDTEAIIRTTVNEIGKKLGGTRVVFEFNPTDENQSKTE